MDPIDCQLIVSIKPHTVYLSHVTGFTSRRVPPVYKISDGSGTLLNTRQATAETGHFYIERGSSAADELLQTLEELATQNIIATSERMYQYVQNADSSTSVFVYTDVILKVFKAEQNQQIHYYASSQQEL